MDGPDKTRDNNVRTPSSGKDGDGVRIVEGAGHGRRQFAIGYCELGNAVGV